MVYKKIRLRFEKKWPSRLTVNIMAVDDHVTTAVSASSDMLID